MSPVYWLQYHRLAQGFKMVLLSVVLFVLAYINFDSAAIIGANGSL